MTIAGTESLEANWNFSGVAHSNSLSILTYPNGPGPTGRIRNLAAAWEGHPDAQGFFSSAECIEYKAG